MTLLGTSNTPLEVVASVPTAHSDLDAFDTSLVDSSDWTLLETPDASLVPMASAPRSRTNAVFTVPVAMRLHPRDLTAPHSTRNLRDGS